VTLLPFMAALPLPLTQIRASPDGSRIAFSDRAIWTIKPDGTGAVRLPIIALTIAPTPALDGCSHARHIMDTWDCAGFSF
jgi:hypothetical protein